MALAIRFEELLASGTVKDYADLARLGGVSRARITQIMNLRLLAPDIQESLLLQERGAHCEPSHRPVDLMGVAGGADWGIQREQWEEAEAEKATASH